MFCENSSPNSFSAFSKLKMARLDWFLTFSAGVNPKILLLYKKIDGVWRVYLESFVSDFVRFFTLKYYDYPIKIDPNLEEYKFNYQDLSHDWLLTSYKKEDLLRYSN